MATQWQEWLAPLFADAKMFGSLVSDLREKLQEDMKVSRWGKG